MLGELQENIISVLKAAQTKSSDFSTAYPAVIRPYGGELTNPKKYITTTPAVMVEVGHNDFEPMDTVGKDRRFNHTVEIILVTKQETGQRERRSAGTELADWALAALRGKTVYVDNQPVYLGRGNTRTLPDLLNPFWAAVITLSPFTEEC